MMQWHSLSIATRFTGAQGRAFTHTREGLALGGMFVVCMGGCLDSGLCAAQCVPLSGWHGGWVVGAMARMVHEASPPPHTHTHNHFVLLARTGEWRGHN